MRPTRRRRLRNAQKGMTLLEIMIVLAILALVMGFVVGPRIYSAFTSSREETQRMWNKKYASEGFLNWARKPENIAKACPQSISELSAELGRKDSNDGWGYELKFLCGPTLPPGSEGGIRIISVGKDGQEGTADDISCDTSSCN